MFETSATLAASEPVIFCCRERRGGQGRRRGSVIDFDPAAMQLHDGRRYGEPEARSLRVALVESSKAFQHRTSAIRRDAGSMIAHRTLRPRSGRNLDHGSRRRVRQGVLDRNSAARGRWLRRAREPRLRLSPGMQ